MLHSNSNCSLEVVVFFSLYPHHWTDYQPVCRNWNQPIIYNRSDIQMEIPHWLWSQTFLLTVFLSIEYLLTHQWDLTEACQNKVTIFILTLDLNQICLCGHSTIFSIRSELFSKLSVLSNSAFSFASVWQNTRADRWFSVNHNGFHFTWLKGILLLLLWCIVIVPAACKRLCLCACVCERDRESERS